MMVPGFSVILIAPIYRRRDALRKAIKEKHGADLWRFAAQPDLTPESFLHDPVFFPCEGDPVPLVKPVQHAPIDENASTSLTGKKQETGKEAVGSQKHQK